MKFPQEVPCEVIDSDSVCSALLSTKVNYCCSGSRAIWCISYTVKKEKEQREQQKTQEKTERTLERTVLPVPLPASSVRAVFHRANLITLLSNLRKDCDTRHFWEVSLHENGRISQKYNEINDVALTSLRRKLGRENQKEQFDLCYISHNNKNAFAEYKQREF